MSEQARLVLVLGLCGSSLWLVLAGPPAAEPPGPWQELGAAERCAVAVERAGEGVTCLDEEEAERLGLAGGDRLLPDAGVGAVGRMAPERLALFAAPLDLNGATLEELESLPGVGRRLAERIVAARPFSSVDELAMIPGVGTRRLRALRQRLRVAVLADGGAPE